MDPYATSLLCPCILQGGILKWFAISSSRASSQPRKPTHVSSIGRQILYHSATRQALTLHWNKSPGIPETVLPQSIRSIRTSSTDLQIHSIFPSDSDGKEFTCNAGELGLKLGSWRSPEEGNDYPLQCSCLENSMTEGPGGLQSMQPQIVEHDSVTKHVHMYKLI